MAAKKNVDPFDSSDDDTSESTREQASELKKKISAEPADEGVELEVDEEDEDDEDEPQQAAPTRQEKRRNRYRELEERRRDAERRAEEAEHRARLAELQHARPQQSQEPQEDPHEQELNAAYEEQSQLNQEWEEVLNAVPAGQAVPTGVAAAYRKRAIELQKRINDAHAERVVARRQPQGGTQNDFVRQRLEVDYPDIMSNGRAQTYLRARAAQILVERGQEQLTWQVVQEAAEQTMRGFLKKTPQRGAPSANDRQRYTGIGRGAGSGGSGGGRSITMDRHQQKMAEGMYPDLPAKQAHQKWANTVGKKLLANQG